MIQNSIYDIPLLSSAGPRKTLGQGMRPVQQLIFSEYFKEICAKNGSVPRNFLFFLEARKKTATIHIKISVKNFEEKISDGSQEDAPIP
jgi:hypothetical protein